MIYLVEWTRNRDYPDVLDFYFSTKKEAEEFIKSLPSQTQLYGEVTELCSIRMKKIKMPETKREWAYTLTHLVKTELGTYQHSQWWSRGPRSRVVSEQEWVHRKGKWSKKAVANIF